MTRFSAFYSYTILAPTVLPKGFVDAREATIKVVKEIALDDNDFRFGHTKVPEFVLAILLCISLLPTALTTPCFD